MCRIVVAAVLAFVAADVVAATTHRITIEGMRFNPASVTGKYLGPLLKQ